MHLPLKPPSSYPWEQLRLVPPTQLSVSFLAHFDGSSNEWQLGVTHYEGPDGDLLGIEVFPMAHTAEGYRAAAELISQTLEGVRQHLAPF